MENRTNASLAPVVSRSRVRPTKKFSKVSEPLKKQITDQRMLKLLRALELVSMFDKEMPMQALLSLMYVSSHDGCHKQALEEEYGFASASCSRNLDRLSKRNVLTGRDGADLIRKRHDPVNGRRIYLELTPTGDALVKKIKEVLFDD